MENSDKLKDWLVAMIGGMVYKPEHIQVEVTKDEMGVLYMVKVDPSDVGIIIGKAGTNAEAIRTLVGVAGRLLDIKASMKIDAPSKRAF